jgi:flagellar biosynthesis protein FliQ
MTVRWFNDVSTWRTWLWFILCAPAAAAARTNGMVISIFIAASSGAIS